MSNFVFNISKGKVAYLAANSPTHFVALLLKSTSLPSDATLIDCADLPAILTAGALECDATAYARLLLTSVTATVNNANDRVDLDSDDLTFPLLGGAVNNTIGKLVICYVPTVGTGTYLTTGGSADSAWVPVSAHDVTYTTQGVALVVAVADFAREA